jgi:hypothetical protein
MTEASDSRLLLLSEQDNVVIARTNLTSGDVVTIDSVQVTLSDSVHLGFKLARGDIVHLHNMQSDYLPTYSHEAGVAFTKRRE